MTCVLAIELESVPTLMFYLSTSLFIHVQVPYSYADIAIQYNSTNNIVKNDSCTLKHVLIGVIFKTLFVRFIRHSEGAVIVVVVARYISHVFM